MKKQTTTVGNFIKLRNYQKAAKEFALKKLFAILAMCPNGGKTEVAIDVIASYLNLNPKHKVLIFTHSTIVLLDNFIERLEKYDCPFSWSIIGDVDFNPDSQVHICLPNSEDKIKGKYDFLIVDEAHENYLAERVQRIIKKIKPKKQLLLTGTPSKFIRKGYKKDDIFTLAMNEISDTYFAKLNIELVASNYNWLKYYNKFEVRENFKYTEQDTEKTLERVILQLLERVKLKGSAKEFNGIDFVSKFKKLGKKKLSDWGLAYKELGRTIVICNETKHADIINKILLKHGVDSNVSHSKNDKKSTIIEEFKNNKYNVLVVVDRARLGYSDDGLFNIIDMSGTHNPDIIYQIFARVLRGNLKMEKYYIKVTPQGNGGMDLTHMVVCAALMLTDKKYLSTFDGKNLNGIPTIILENPPRERKKKKGSVVIDPVDPPVRFPSLRHDVIDFFKNVIANLNNPNSIYKETTIGEVRYRLGQFKNQKPWKLTDYINFGKN